MSRPHALRTLLARDGALVVPGGGSPLEIRLIEAAGFEAAYVSGYATAAARYGVPDVGLIGYAEIEEMVRASRAVTTLPLIVDCDTGYGDVANVRRTVQGIEAAGAAAVQIEDQVWPKRCGHMDGKIVEPADVAVRKVEAAVAARRSDETVVVARTDARGPHGLDEAFRRCRLFKEAGADVLFVDGPQSIEELERIGRELPGPLLANMSETGRTPLRSARELAAMGYRIALFPSSTVRIGVKVVGEFLRDLRHAGDSRPWVDRMASLEETNAAVGLDVLKAFEREVLARRRHV
jgi:2-methylisocitrate lyase-like PEP mutase family enzyme